MKDAAQEEVDVLKATIARHEETLANMPKNLKGSMHFGFFDIIAKPLNQFLNFLYGYVGNYGIAIIILTLIIKILF